jgi:hypothetical protein
VNHRDIVRERHPDATARQFKAVYQYGAATAPPGTWTIYPSESLGVHTLGIGATEEEAWAAAAAEILAAQAGLAKRPQSA